MIIMEEPYVSDFFRKTVIKNQWSVLQNKASQKILKKSKLLLSENDFINRFKVNNPPLLYTNSENSLEWINNNLTFTKYHKPIDLFKNKVAFRESLKSIYPDFFFRKVLFSEIDILDPAELKSPCIIKPAKGTGSIGVKKITSYEQYNEVKNFFITERRNTPSVFPSAIIDINQLIIEESIDGEEFAIEFFFDAEQKPVIINVMQHVFIASDDVSDALYITSKEIIEQNYHIFYDFLCNINKIFNLKNFPFVIEVRKKKDNIIVPIEFNPMRFNGWCESDFSYYIYGINAYEGYFYNKSPNWQSILREKSDTIYSIIMPSVPKEIMGKNFKFHYEKFLSHFSQVIYVLKINYLKYPYFGIFLIKNKKSDLPIISNILHLELSNFIEVA